MSWTKKAIKTFSYLSYLSIVVLLLLEVVFRVLPTSDSFYLQAVTHEEPITRFEENRELTKQIGFDFSHVTSKHINNFGFATDRDFFLSESDSNLIFAVIGDSYVEAMQIKNKDTFHAKLDANLKNVVVYPFGVSGSPLSQYLAFADYAKKNFKPDFFIFLIISNDFDESWYEIKQAPGFHYFNPDGSLKLIEYILHF